MIEGIAGTFFSDERLDGFDEVLAEYPNMEVLGEPIAADWNREKGVGAAEDFLSRYSPEEMNYIWAASNEMGLGAIQAPSRTGSLNDGGSESQPADGSGLDLHQRRDAESADAIRDGTLIAETHHGFPEWGWSGPRPRSSSPAARRWRSSRTSSRGRCTRATSTSSIRSRSCRRSTGTRSRPTANKGVPLLQARGIGKSYPGVSALAGVDIQVDAGEIHALLGQNGAGKSTLMKVIAGTVEPDAGEISVDGELVDPGSPDVARARGIGLVHQEMSLIPPLSVAENVLMARWPMRRGQVDWGTLRERAQVHLDRVGFGPDSRTEVRELGMAERQLVEVAKALSQSVQGPAPR